MSWLPGAERAFVADAKARDYLLNPDNPQNRGKARRFGQFGFTRGDWPTLIAALTVHPVMNKVVKIVSEPYGIKYVVECTLPTPDGRNPCMRSVWLIEIGESAPRLVTAY